MKHPLNNALTWSCFQIISASKDNIQLIAFIMYDLVPPVPLQIRDDLMSLDKGSEHVLSLRTSV